MSFARSAVIGIVLSLVFPIALAGCEEAPPALPAVLVSVATDVSVPRAVSRLRIDVFAEDGTWLHARDHARPHANDWPVTFGVFSPDESKETTVLVRLRAYAEGATRDYLGERYEPRGPVEPHFVAQSLEELCAQAPELLPFEERTLRRGATALTTDGCGQRPTRTGAVAVTVTIPVKGRYRFEVIDSVPGELLGAVDTTLFLRRDCRDQKTELACHDDIDDASVNLLSRLVVDLEPGKYTLMTGGGFLAEPADLTLRWAPEAEWGPEGKRPPPPLPSTLVSNGLPRVRSEKESTPTTEPSPFATIDRLVRLRLRPGDPHRVEVVLRGACAGVMANLAVDAEGRVRIGESTTCVDGASNELIPVPLEAEGDATPAGTSLSDDACTDEDSDEQIVCVPGGAFALGGEDFGGNATVGATLLVASSVPTRLVGLKRFFIDRNEFTVGRYREALTAGFRSRTLPPIERDDPARPPSGQPTFTSRPGSYERHPLNQVGWQRARDLCKFFDGDLPSEAQWEYAAAAAGRDRKATYPWGEAVPTCRQAVLAGKSAPADPLSCPRARNGPVAVDDPRMAEDVNVLGIVGLGGNVTEWVRDAHAPFDSVCWRATGPIDPVCEDDPLIVSHRGGAWSLPGGFSRATHRMPFAPVIGSDRIGFRCVYSAPPTRRWKGP